MAWFCAQALQHVAVPRGKYQTSPGSKSFGLGEALRIDHRGANAPSMTNAHPPQWRASGSPRIAPARAASKPRQLPLEIGSCSTVASLPKLCRSLAGRLLQCELECRQVLAEGLDPEHCS